MNKSIDHPPINIPLMLALDASTRSFLIQHSIRFSRFRLSDSRIIHGLRINAYHFSNIKSFILNNHLLTAELRLHNLARERADFIDLSKGFTYSVLSWSFVHQVISILQKNDIIAQWNRAYPRLLIRWDGSNDAYFRTLGHKYRNPIQKRQHELLTTIEKAIKILPDFSEEQHDFLTTTAWQLLASCPPALLILLFLFPQGYTPAIKTKIADQLLVTLQQTRVADYLALLLVEFAMQVSRTEVTEVPSAPSKETSVTWEFIFPHQDESKHLRMQILLSNAISTYHSFRKRLSRFSSNMMKHATLQEYYLNSSDPEKENLLGLTYPDLVATECRKVGLHFETFVNTFSKSNQALFNVILRV